MFFLYDTKGHKEKFQTMDELREFVEMRHAEDGGFDWISEIKDEHGKQYGCSWSLEIEQL